MIKEFRTAFSECKEFAITHKDFRDRVGPGLVDLKVMVESATVLAQRTAELWNNALWADTSALAHDEKR